MAWFTMQAGQGRAYIAFSSDAGRTFGAPVRVDDAGSTGRVQVELLADGSAAVSWIEFGKGPSQLKVRTRQPERRTVAAGRHRPRIRYTVPPDGRREGRAGLRVDRELERHHAPLHGTRQTVSNHEHASLVRRARPSLPPPPAGGGNEPPPFKPIADTALLMEAFIDPSGRRDLGIGRHDHHRGRRGAHPAEDRRGMDGGAQRRRRRHRGRQPADDGAARQGRGMDADLAGDDRHRRRRHQGGRGQGSGCGVRRRRRDLRGLHATATPNTIRPSRGCNEQSSRPDPVRPRSARWPSARPVSPIR